MTVIIRIPSLKSELSSDAEILTDSDSSRFKELLKRWTDIDLKVPGAIVLPVSEQDCQKTVQWAARESIPFVIKSGGHSAWSTIGSYGIIIDLDKYSEVRVDSNSKVAVLKGSVLSKEVAVALAQEGLFTALGNGNTVGAIPYFLNGGASIVSSIAGFGSDQIVSARMISAKGDIITVSEKEHPDLLYGIRGAGQFFGLITELTVKAYPLSDLGNDKGVIWTGSFVFPLDRAKEVFPVMKKLMEDSTHATAGLMMVMSPPPTRSPSLVISARHAGDPNDVEKAFKTLYDLKPAVVNGAAVPIQNACDGREALGAKGGFKEFGIVGLHQFDQDAFLKVIDIWKEMIAECPDAINTAFNFQWDSRFPKKPDIEGAMPLHDIRYWLNNLIWHTDPTTRSKVDEYNNKSIAIMRNSEEEDRYVDFQNGTRNSPVERRYRGKERLDRLKKLKKEWDPTGVFTNQLLE